MLCPGCPHRAVFYVLKKMNLTVAADIGCYTLGAMPPLNAVDSVVCMGASIGMALGLEKARGRDFAKHTVAVIGDSTFVHSGITGLVDVVYNQGNSTVIIVDNSTTGMTGHQPNPTTGQNVRGEIAPQLDVVKLCQAIGVPSVRVVDPFDMKLFEQVLREECGKDGPSVVIARRPCALLIQEEGRALHDRRRGLPPLRHVPAHRLPGACQGRGWLGVPSTRRCAPAAACARRCATSARSKEARGNMAEKIKDLNIVICGVGGQGTLLASRILGHMALSLGHDVKVSEVHGMSQRGGSVITYVRMGEKVYSPMIEQKGADYVLAFEELEALRDLPYLKDGGTLVVNTQHILPLPVIIGAAKYPENILETLRARADVVALDALPMAGSGRQRPRGQRRAPRRPGPPTAL